MKHLITSKYNSNCEWCGRLLAPGVRIFWEKGEGTACYPQCPEPGSLPEGSYRRTWVKVTGDQSKRPINDPGAKRVTAFWDELDKRWYNDFNPLRLALSKFKVQLIQLELLQMKTGKELF